MHFDLSDGNKSRYERLLDSDTDLNPSKKKKPKAKLIPYIQRLPRELLDHILSYTSIVSHGNFLSYLGYGHWKSNSRILLWSSNFKSDVWLQLMVEKHKAKVVLVGSQLHELSGKQYIILYICHTDPFSTLRECAYSWNLFRVCLHEHSVISNAEIVFSSGIILNPQCLLDDFSMFSSVSLLKQTMDGPFMFRNEKPVLQYSFYKTYHIQDLSLLVSPARYCVYS
jgi:hypothetical protein